jgi:hypothetical protein
MSTRKTEGGGALQRLLGRTAAGRLRARWPERAEPLFQKRAPAADELLAALDVFKHVQVLTQLHGRFRALPGKQPADKKVDLEPRQFALLFQSGVWLVLPDVDRTVAGCRAWIEPLAAELGLPASSVSCNLYLSSGEGVWTPPPDGRDAFYLGARGTAGLALGSGRGRRAHALARGSALFAPRDRARAFTARGECHLLAFELRQPTWLDLLDEEIYQRLVRLERWREPVGPLWGTPAQRRAEIARFEALLQRLAADLGPLDASELLRRHAAGKRGDGPQP